MSRTRTWSPPRRELDFATPATDRAQCRHGDRGRRPGRRIPGRGEAALRHARSFVVTSTSAFIDDRLLKHLIAIAEKAGSRVIVPSGALGDLGALAAGSILSLDQVCSIIKPPRAWLGTKAVEVIDLGGVQQQILRVRRRRQPLSYPQNANVAVITALSGLGLDRTRVVLVADPTAKRNCHEVRASGNSGSSS